MKRDLSPMALRRAHFRSLILVGALTVASGCGAAGDESGDVGSGDVGPGPVAGPEPGAPVERADRGESGASDDVQSRSTDRDVVVPPMEELVAALDAVPAGLELGLEEALRLPEDPADWEPIATVGGDPVVIVREFHPSSGALMRIATARPSAPGATGGPVLHGPEWRYHETGSQRSVQWWRDDDPHGSVRQWRRVGTLAREGCFWEGQRDGLWREYSKNAQLIEQAIYVRGTLVGPSRSWFASGQQKSVGSHRDGRLHGHRQVWNRDGILVLDETYVDGELHGRWSDFHLGDGDPREWGMYEYGKRVGRWQRGSAEGVVLASVEYVEGVLEGQGRVWNGDKVLIEESMYVEGSKTGPSRTWFASGEVQSHGRLENGRRIGRWTYWKNDGTVNERWSGLYEDDLRVAPLDNESTPR